MEDRTADYKARPPEWRIEAVIHDGSWYDIKKWARVAKVKPDVLEDWIAKNKKVFHLIRSEIGHSYRVSYDEVLRWYSTQEDISITDKIIPNNYPPRLWDGQTEVEAFIAVPRRDTSTLTFDTMDDDLIKKTTKALSGVARVRYDTNDKHRAYGLSDEYMRQVLVKELTSKDIENLNIKKRKSILRRELTDFSSQFVEDALQFYLPFSRNILKTHMSTLKIYLPDEQDLDSQIIAWIVSAMRKFDETQPIPFSGYLNSVLRFWPYDLPDEVLGKELSNFQRQRQKAIQVLSQEQGTDKILANVEIAERMEIDLKDYTRLNNQHETWLAERNATTLNWSDSANEKSGTIVGSSETSASDVRLAHNISIAAINAGLTTSNFEEASIVIKSMDKNQYDEERLADLSTDFKQEFAHELYKAGAMLK